MLLVRCAQITVPTLGVHIDTSRAFSDCCSCCAQSKTEPSRYVSMAGVIIAFLVVAGQSLRTPRAGNGLIPLLFQRKGCSGNNLAWPDLASVLPELVSL